MEPNQNVNASEPVGSDAEAFGKDFPKHSEAFGTIPNLSELASEPLPIPVARTIEHTLTVHEVSRLFEVAGVPITEKTVTNWCHPDKAGRKRLDGVYDESDRRWYIAPQSVDECIKEERFRKRQNVPAPISETAEILSEHYGNVPNDISEKFVPLQKDETPSSEEFRSNVPNHSATQKSEAQGHETRDKDLEKENAELKQKIFDLQVLNKGKDFFMDEMKKFNKEIIDRIETSNHKIGELEKSLALIEAPKERRTEDHDYH